MPYPSGYGTYHNSVIRNSTKEKSEMTIFDFNTDKGIYNFEFIELTTEVHSHPVVEIINAIEGHFSIESNNKAFENLKFAIIDSNTKHKITSQESKLKLLMIESHNFLFSEFLHNKKIKTESGIFAKSNLPNRSKLFSDILNYAKTNDLKIVKDERINLSLKLIGENDISYKNLIPTLTSKVCLSDSRLSHLFKEHIGVSIKKYLIWNKLKMAINNYLSSENNLTNVSIESGFFDQAHMINSFKSILGVNPSKAYNSRTLQS